MASEKLPWDLVKEIFSWLPVKSLFRFRTVCKLCSSLFEDEVFAKNHLAHTRYPQFILFSESVTCSVEVNLNDDVPSIKVCKLPLVIPDYSQWVGFNVEYCDGLLLCAMFAGVAVCNPWSKQTKWLPPNVETPAFCGIGYDTSRPDKHYKIFVSDQCNSSVTAWITEFGSDAWKLYKFESDNWRLISKHGVSLNGTLYWVAHYIESREYFIQSFDFSMETFKPFCVLPCNKGLNAYYDHRSLSVFRGDRFSFLEINNSKYHIEIWVTKRKINDEEDVEWVKFMNMSYSALSCLQSIRPFEMPSYFIDEKSGSLVLCFGTVGGQAYIYITKGDKSYYKFKPDSVADDYPCHLAYFPSLVQLPL